jgi:hypothetical protein
MANCERQSTQPAPVGPSEQHAQLVEPHRMTHGMNGAVVGKPPAVEHAQQPHIAGSEQKPALCTFERVLEGDFQAVALEASPHVAALSDSRVFWHREQGFRSEPLPTELVSSTARLDVFFGRDLRPRIVGTLGATDSTRNTYLRWTDRGIRSGREELGRLARATSGPLIAVLGLEDPEIVCSPGEVCIVKRLSGWTTLQAPKNITGVAISGGHAYAIAGSRLLRAEGARFGELGPGASFREPTSFVVRSGTAYVLDGPAGLLHTLAQPHETWAVSSTPVVSAQSMWVGDDRTVWVGGQGLSQLDGGEWRAAAGVQGLVREVTGRSGCDVWVATDQGLYSGKSST